MNDQVLPGHRPLTDEQRQLRATVAAGKRGGIGGPNDVWSQSPGVMEAATALSDVLRSADNGLGSRLTELAILITARAWTAQIEWFAHAPRARRAGISRDVVGAIAERKTPSFEQPDEQAVYNLVHQLANERALQPGVFEKATELLGTEAVIKLTALVGFYGMVATTLNVFELVPPPDATRLLPE